MEASRATWGTAAAPLNDSRVDPALRRSVLVLFGAVTFVLLIACANVAALMLARARRRGDAKSRSAWPSAPAAAGSSASF